MVPKQDPGSARSVASSRSRSAAFGTITFAPSPDIPAPATPPRRRCFSLSLLRPHGVPTAPITLRLQRGKVFCFAAQLDASFVCTGLKVCCFLCRPTYSMADAGQPILAQEELIASRRPSGSNAEVWPSEDLSPVSVAMLLRAL